MPHSRSETTTEAKSQPTTQADASTPTLITEPEQIQQRLQALQRSPTINLHSDATGNAFWPVKLVQLQPDTGLTINVRGAEEVLPLLERGAEFWLVGETDDRQISTAGLRLPDEQPNKAGQIACTYPELLHITPQRTDFRAPVTRNMHIHVQMENIRRSAPAAGRVDNLSMGGCLLVLPLADCAMLYGETRLARLTIRFPNGERLDTQGRIRHIRADAQHAHGLVGFQFEDDTAEFQRRIAHYVHEIDRHRAYEETGDDFAYTPSKLFSASLDRRSAARQRSTRPDQATKRLLAIADWLDAQLIQLKAGGPLATQTLRKHAQELVRLLRADRELLLFATSRLRTHPYPVRHGVTLAVRVADLLEWQNLHTHPLDAVMACALIHDFGKALLPDPVRNAPTPLSTDQRATMTTHVQLLTARLPNPDDLPSEVVQAVIEQPNERLDGSGYPRALEDDSLSTLARLTAVVDVADAMRQDRPDRKALPLVAVYKHLLQAQATLDNAWVQRYIRRYGMTPIGSLAHYSNGLLVWVRRLDSSSKPVQVEVALAGNGEPPPRKIIVEGDELVKLGEFKTLVEAEDYGLG